MLLNFKFFIIDLFCQVCLVMFTLSAHIMHVLIKWLPGKTSDDLDLGLSALKNSHIEWFILAGVLLPETPCSCTNREGTDIPRASICDNRPESLKKINCDMVSCTGFFPKRARNSELWPGTWPLPGLEMKPHKDKFAWMIRRFQSHEKLGRQVCYQGDQQWISPWSAGVKLRRPGG